MGNYKANSNWSDVNELKCLQILKQLIEANFPRGLQKQLCRKLSSTTNLKWNSISAKVSNYKSIAGLNSPSNASNNTKYFYELFGNYSSQQLEAVINGYAS